MPSVFDCWAELFILVEIVWWDQTSQGWAEYFIFFVVDNEGATIPFVKNQSTPK